MCLNNKAQKYFTQVPLVPLVTNFKSAIKYDTSKTILCNDTWFVLQRTILGLIKRSLPRDSLYTDEMFLSHLCEQVKTARKCWTHFARQTHQLAPKWWSKGRGEGWMNGWRCGRESGLEIEETALRTRRCSHTKIKARGHKYGNTYKYKCIWAQALT